MPQYGVRLYRWGFNRGQKRWVGLPQGACTDERGAYQIERVPLGRYYLGAAPGCSSEQNGAGGYPEVYYGGTSDPLRAVPVDMAPGGLVAGINIRLARVELTTIRGTVVNLTGIRDVPIVIALNMATGRIAAPPVQGAPDGKFELRGVAPGSYVLTASLRAGNRVSDAKLALAVGPDPMDGVRLTLRPGATVSGTVREEGSESAALSNYGKLTIALFSRDMLQPWTRSANVDEGGGFTLSNVPPGMCDLMLLDRPSGYYLKMAWRGDVNVLDDGLDTSLIDVPLQLVVSRKAARVGGLVTDDEGSPVHIPLVALVPRDPKRAAGQQWYWGATGGGDGHYSAVVAPGKYRAFAWPYNHTPASQDLGGGMAYMDPEFMRPFEDKGVALDLSEGDSQTLDLKVLPLPY